MNVYRLSQVPTAVDVRRTVTRSWQHRPAHREPVIAASTNRLFGENPTKGRPALTDRNLRRITNSVVKSKPIHWNSADGLEPKDVKPFRNAARRRRQRR